MLEGGDQLPRAEAIAMAADPSSTRDRELVQRSRGGDGDAFAELYRRYAPGAWRLAVAVNRTPHRARAAVADAFARVLGGDAPVDTGRALRPQILAATRSAATDVEENRGGTAIADLSPASNVAPDIVLHAFRGLPERSRAALWLADGERLDERDVAQALELPADAAADLTGRARAALRERFLLTHLATVTSAECEHSARLLDGYATEELSIREASRVRRHLDGCADCRSRLTELDDLAPLLRRHALPVPAPLVDDVERAWRAAVAAGAARGPLHLTLPSGRPVPVWAERAVAGAAAAVITLGITGAILAGGRGKPRQDLSRETASEEPTFGGDGESALGSGDDLPLVLPEGQALPDIGSWGGGGSPAQTTSTRGPAASAATPGNGTGGGSPAPSSSPSTDGAGSGTPAPAEPSEPSPAAPPSPTAPTGPTGPAPEAPPAPTPEADPGPLAPVLEPLAPVVEAVEDVVDEVVGIVGGDSTSGGLLGLG